IATGMWTVISRLDWLRIFQRPSSRLSLWAANSNRAACASHGLVSCDITVVMPSPNFEAPPGRAVERETETQHEWMQIDRGTSVRPPQPAQSFRSVGRAKGGRQAG